MTPSQIEHLKLIDAHLEWIIQTPDGRSCKWSNAIIIAIPFGEFDFYA